MIESLLLHTTGAEVLYPQSVTFAAISHVDGDVFSVEIRTRNMCVCSLTIEPPNQPSVADSMQGEQEAQLNCL